MIYKRGVVIHDLHPVFAEAIEDKGVIDMIFRRLAGRHGFVTSIRDEGHGPNSFHYYGRAGDWRTNDMTTEAKRRAEQEMQEELGDDWTVRLEFENKPQEHIHAQYEGD
ncbi:hypothetical protein LCGC14_3099220 [marine sediment metagenome]|uniref:Uncharacterized protein n=1 Tax=marine sediment metagenome TaxID=412755 RepID=A0A0F8W876_9ZZZZ